MDPLQWSMSSIASVIQTSVAPVFLLAGISALLGVMTNRLGRIIDRSRVLQCSVMKAVTEDSKLTIEQGMAQLLQRGRLIYIAITCATTSALLVCLVIMSLFLGDVIKSNFSQIVAGLFIVCMALLITALIFFLIEVFIAIKSMRKEMTLEIAKKIPAHNE